MSMEQRITTLEEVIERVTAALRQSNAARERLRQGAALRDQATLELGAAVDRSAEAIRRLDDTVANLQGTLSRLEGSMQEIDEASQQSDEAVQALLAYLPISQAEIVRLDNRIDAIEGA